MLRGVNNMLSSFKLVRLWPRAINTPRRMLCADSVRDLCYDEPFASLLEAEEGVAVFKGDDKWFEPTIPFDEDGKLLVPKNLSPAYVPIMKQTEHLYTQAHPAVVRLRVLFEENGHNQVFYATGFALSPKIIFTDYHCVPPTTSIYVEGNKIRVTFKSVHARWSPLNTREQHYEKDSVPLEIVSRENELSEDTPVVDPISGLNWRRGRGNADLAVLKVPDDHPFSFSSYLFPAVLSTELLSGPVGYMGYPQIIRGLQIEKIMAVIKASGYKFKQFVDILPKEQDMAACLAIEAALQQSFSDYNVKVVSVGDVKKAGQSVLAVTNSSTTGTSGSPYFALDCPSKIIGNHLGSGVYAYTALGNPASGHQAPVYPNYNLVMTNEHPEWVLKYAKYVVPSLPENTRKEVQPYLLKHQGLLQGVITPAIQTLLK